jgi:serine/threonine protein kinase
MATCRKCGFESLGEGEACRVCGEVSFAEAVPLSNAATDVDATVVRGEETVARGSPPSSKLPNVPGKVYADRFRIDALVGQGGMGSVYRVTDLATTATMALKILDGGVVGQAGGLPRFRREIEVLQKLDHPAIPTIYDSGIVDGEMYFVAAFIEGDNLREIIRREGAFPVDRTLAIVSAVGDALNKAHEHGVIHRDVKPHNIMIDRDGGVHLLDFGLARGVGIDMKTITASGMIVGTPEYMSPEQFEGSRVDARSDIYSLGVVMFQMLTGSLPFEGDTPMALALKHTQQVPPDPRSIRRDLPAWLGRIVLRCLEKDPRRRYPTAEELVAALVRTRSDEADRRRMPNGDWIVVGDEHPDGYVMTVVSTAEKSSWTAPLTLLLEGRYYRLSLIEIDPGPPERWLYHFDDWPESEVFRKVVDYAEHCAEMRAKPKGLRARLKKMLE